jgi:DNA-binding response OmpR family regulator
MSGYVENSFLDQEVFASGGPPYIQKPFEINALAGKVRELLDGAAE